MPDRKNLIISGDLHETQYTYEDRYLDHLYIRRYQSSMLGCSPLSYLQALSRQKEIQQQIVELFNNSSFYTVLLACLGDKYRSVDGIRGIKMSKLIKILVEGLESKRIESNTKSPMLLADLFPDELKEQIYHNILLLSINNEYQMLCDGDKKGILSQIVDRSDISALQHLNQTKFANNQLRLECLLK